MSESKTIWQPIETAPQDGSTLIGMGFYDFYHKEIMLAAPIRSKGGGWSRDNNGYGFTVSCHPTYWMPLPEPPNV